MKKIITTTIGLLFILNGFSQQTFTNFENASMVIGQPTFQSQYTNRSDSIAGGPAYSAISSKGMLAVAEQTRGSVKIWYSLPTRNGQPADVEVGNPSFTTQNGGPTQAYAANFDGVAWSPDGNKLIAACGSQNRVLIWNSVPATNGQPADVVLGQLNFTSTTAGNGASNLRYPCGVMVSPDGRLLVGEYNNNRVLVWNNIPTVNGTPADVVIGQSGFNLSGSGDQANRLDNPWGVNLSPDGKLLIANTGNNNVFIYDSIPVSNGESATVVIGHEAFGQATAGVSDSTLSTPVAATVTPHGKVAIGEFGNSRVLIFDSVPTSNGAHADVVLGQADFNSNTIFAPSGTADTNNLRRPYNVSTDLNGRLYVAGRDMYRVMVYGDLPVDSADLNISIEESSSSLCDSSDVVYIIKVNNPGPDTAKSVVATTAFPLGYSIDNITVPDGTYNQSSGYWNIPAIAPNDSAMLIINGIVKGGMSGQTITTYANIISSSAIDTNLVNNGTSVSVTILAISKPADPVASNTATCFGSTALLSASGTGTLSWYGNIDDVVALDTGNTYTTDPLSSATTYYVEANNGCPSYSRTPVDVSINPVYNQSETVTVCSGDSYTFPDGTVINNITSTTLYTSNLLSISGCDSIIATTVNVNPVYNLSETTAVCNGEGYTFPDGFLQSNITSTVVHVSNLFTIYGCDSVITTTVNVNPVYNLSETTAVCNGESYTFPDGFLQSNITSTVVHVSNLFTIYGCDSVITTTVNVNPVYNLSETTSVCSGESYTFPDGTVQNDITSTVVYASNLVSIDGCDSIITTTVTVNPVYNISETVSICSGESYTFPDGTTVDNITSTTIYTSNLVTIDGCDSTINTTVTVNPVYNLSETVTICNGESYTFPDGTTEDNITSTILYASNLVTVDGCDSIINTTVTVNPAYNLSETVTICSGESYTFPDGTTQDNIISSVSYISNLVTLEGCDSIIVTNVDIASVDVSVSLNGTTITANTEGADYQWIDCGDNKSLITGETSQSFTPSQSGDYQVIVSENGCSDTSACYSVIVSGIDESNFKQDITIYPNPVKDIANIILPDYYSNVSINVFNMQGQMVIYQRLAIEHNELQLDLQELNAGVYLIQLNADDDSTVIRILKD